MMNSVKLILLANLMLALVTCKKKTVDSPKMSVAPKIEAVIFSFGNSSDSLTGQYLRPVMDSLRLMYPEIVVLNAHLNHLNGKNDSLSNPDSEEFAYQYNIDASNDSANGIPYAYFNCDGYIGGMKHGGIKFKDIEASIKWARETKTAFIDYNIVSTVTNNQLKVDLNFKTLQDLYIPTYFSVILTEDNVFEVQKNDKGIQKNVHHDVLRKAITNVKGDIVQKTIAKDVSATFTCQTTLDSNWKKENMKVNVIVWYSDNIYGKMVHYGKRVALNN